MAFATGALLEGRDGFALALRDAQGLGAVFDAVGAGGVAVDELEALELAGGVGGCTGGCGLGAVASALAVVPGAQAHALGAGGACGLPIRQAVFFEAGAGAAGVADVGLCAGLEGAVVVGDDEGVFALGVLEPVVEALFNQQPLEEGEVGLVELGGEAASGVDARVGQLPAPGGGQGALAPPVAEQLVDDLGDALVLEDVAVLALAEKGEPGAQAELVAAQTAVAAQEGCRGDVGVDGAQGAGAGGGQQLDEHRLAEQGLQVDGGNG